MGQRLRNLPGFSGIDLRAVSTSWGPEWKKFARSAGLVVCTDECTDHGGALAMLGECCSRNRRFIENPLPVVLLSRRRNSAAEVEGLSHALRDYPFRILSRSIPSVAARRLLQRYPLHLGVDVGFGQTMHILIVGYSDLGVAIAVQALRLAHYGLGLPRLTFASDQPEPDREEFFAEFPEASEVAGIHFTDLALSGIGTGVPVTSAYVCGSGMRNQIVRLETLQGSLRSRQTAGPPVFCEIGDARISNDVSSWDGQTFPFSALSEVGDPGVLFDDRDDELAVIIHDYYRDSIAAQGRPLEGNPAGEPWERLGESFRQASRHQADHMIAKLAAINCRAVPEQESEFFVFYPREVEKLARTEHDRWRADRYLNGWKYGLVRDNEKKIHPEMIPYDDLSKDMKDLDRYTVRLLPALLGRKGLAIRRNLVVAVITSSAARRAGQHSLNAVDSIFNRLAARYPDRTLVIAIDLADEIQGTLAKRASEHWGATLWSLIVGSLDRIWMGMESERRRIECFEILALSERRICLEDRDEMTRWSSRRAEIALILGRLPEPGRGQVLAGMGADNHSAALAGPREVRLDPETGVTGWSFEY